MKHKTLKTIISLALCMMTLFVLFIPSASAASNVCRQISGSSKAAKTFTVKTGYRWLFSDKLKITTTKGTLAYMDLLSRNKTAKVYDVYTITIKKVGGKTVTKTCAGGSITLKLDKNATYKITVTPANSSVLQQKYFSLGYTMGWKTYPTWKVSSTNGIISCN